MSGIRPLHFGKLLPPPYAGVEAHIDLLLRALCPQVRGTLLACGDPSDTERRAPEFPYRLLVERFFGRLASAPVAPGMLTAVQRELRSGRCNLLHLHAPNPLGDLAALAFAGRAPVVLSWHSDIVRQRGLLRAYAPIQRRIIDRADAIVVFTPKHYESSAQLRQARIEHKLHVIPMGIDFSPFDAERADPRTLEQLDRIAAGRPLLLTVGRHVYYKGYDHLIDAFARLKGEPVLAMIGTGPLGSELRARAQARGVSSRIHFMGEVPRPALAAAYHRCDVFALPSIAPSEAFGIASAEAMSCGKPTVVCDLGNGVNHLNRDGETSLTVKAGDVAALAEALATLLGDAALRRRMGDAASRWVRDACNVQRMREQTIALYRLLQR